MTLRCSSSKRWRQAKARGPLLGSALALLLAVAGEPAAADILRSGAARGNNSARNAEARQQAGADAAAAAQQTSQDRLAQTTQALTAMRNMQAAARAAARTQTVRPPGQGGVVDGLHARGLAIDTVNPRWEGAALPQQRERNGQTEVLIRQTAQQAVLHWQKFDVGSRTTVRFNQRAGGVDSGKWVAFNRVTDPSGRPSQILGSIQAEGQVYIVNQNGIIFGPSSQVNVRSLVASSLPVNDNLIARGLLNNPDAQFLFSAFNLPGGSDGTPEFIAPTPPPGGYGDVIVQRGALLRSRQEAGGSGGRIMLVGPNVRNEGEILTPGGQTILAAGMQVGARAHPPTDPSLRGLDVWIGRVEPGTGTASNAGLIEALEGNITMAGREVVQAGVLESSTSVDLNGRIDLLASYGAVMNPNFDAVANSVIPPFVAQFTGTVTMAPGSLTRILPDFTSGKRIPGTELPQRSQINIDGMRLDFASNSTVLAPSGNVRLRAGAWGYRDTNGDGTTLGPDGRDEPGLAQQFFQGNQRFLFRGGEIHFGPGSLVDVSGVTGAFVPLGDNIVTVQLRGSELADSPLQRNSMLRGTNLTIDLRRSGTFGGREWVGTPLGDLTGLAGLTERDAAQLSTRGGTIDARSGGSLTVAPGATLDVSGGYSVLEGGYVQTSRLLRAGQLVDMHEAFPTVPYDGIFTGMTVEFSDRWGQLQSFMAPLAPLGGGTQPDAIQGASAGTLALSAPRMSVAGELRGRALAGAQQLDAPPRGGTLNLSFRAQDVISTGASGIVFVDTSPSVPVVGLGEGPGQVPSTGLTLGEEAEVVSAMGERFHLQPQWFTSEGGGFANVQVDNPDGEFVLAAGQELRLLPGGSLGVTVANAEVGGSIVVPGGSVSVRAFNFSPIELQLLEATGALVGQTAPPVIEGRGNITLLPGAQISTAGMVYDARIGVGELPLTPVLVDAGDISLEGFNVTVPEGSSLDASGGLFAASVPGAFFRGSGNGVLIYGRGGNITLHAGRDLNLATSIGGQLTLGGTLRSLAVNGGGRLSLQSTRIQVGGNGVDPGEGTLVLQPEFFQQGGFTSYRLTGLGHRDAEGVVQAAVEVMPGTIVEPLVDTVRALPFAGAERSLTLETVRLPVGQRPTAELELRALRTDDTFTEEFIEGPAFVSIGEGARLQTDPGGSIRMQADTIAVEGSLIAPGGSISIVGANSFPTTSLFSTQVTRALPTVVIGSQALLSTAGTFVSLPDPLNLGRQTGRLFAGGSISISGNLILQAGSVLDVSGAMGMIDVHPTQLDSELRPPSLSLAGLTSAPWRTRTVRVAIDSDAGSISLTGSQFLYSDATLLGRPGGPTAQGGTLSIFSGRYYDRTETQRSSDINLMVESRGSAARFGGVAEFGDLRSVLTETVAPLDLYQQPAKERGIGHFALEHFASGGFFHLDLGYRFLDQASPIPFGGNVRFLDRTNITARGSIRLAGGGVIESKQAISISAPYVAIGQPFRPPRHPSDPFLPFVQFSGSTQSLGPLLVEPTGGLGRLNVRADLIDVGTTVLRGISRVELDTGVGDVRGNGIFNMVGDLVIRAGQVYPTTLAQFDIFAYDAPGRPGSVSIFSSVSPPLPWSAGGSLGIYASTIHQAGNLRAPFGRIRLGWDGLDVDPTTAALDAPANAVVGTLLAAPVTKGLFLRGGSQTSVSGVDPTTGEQLLLPYGLSPDGLTWIDPRGVDITTSGLVAKAIGLRGDAVRVDPNALVDVRGGGDLLAYRWVAGPGGNVDLLGTAARTWSAGGRYSAGDLVLDSAGRTWSARVDINPADFAVAPAPRESRFWRLVPDGFALVPGYMAGFAPYNTFNTGLNAGSLGGDPGYVGRNLRLGQQVTLPELGSLREGRYTLLPRRYGIMPGAHLVLFPTSSPGSLLNPSVPSSRMPDGGYLTRGVLTNSLLRGVEDGPLGRAMEILPPRTLVARAQYELFSANRFLAATAEILEVPNPQLLPRDAGRFSVHANAGLTLRGDIRGWSETPGGRGAEIDISSAGELLLLGSGAANPSARAAVVRVEDANRWGAESLLFGGLRYRTPDGVAVDVRSPAVTLNNAGRPLVAPDVTLVSRGEMTVAGGSSILARGSLPRGAMPLLLSGDGVALRVSNDEAAFIQRSNTADSTVPILRVGAGARLVGQAITLDSTYALAVAPTAQLRSRSLALGAGQISVVFDPNLVALAGSVVPNHLVLRGDLLATVGGARNLRLVSYRTIDFYGAGSLGRQGPGRIELLSGGLRSFSNSGRDVVVQGQRVVLGNPQNVAALPAPLTPPSGRIVLQGEVIELGANTNSVSGVNTLVLEANQGILAAATGSLVVPGSLELRAPAIAGGQGANYELNAVGELVATSLPGRASVVPGLGSQLTFRGSSVTMGTRVSAPSGLINLEASTGDVIVGGRLGVGGTEQRFYDQIRYTGAGEIRVTATLGNIRILETGGANVSAPAGGGDAGLLSLRAPQGVVELDGIINGRAGRNALAGRFRLDAAAVDGFNELMENLDGAGFFEERNLRVRTGDISITGSLQVRDFSLSTDAGSITVAGSIDAGGTTGGRIFLSSAQNLTVKSGAVLSVAARQFNAAGRGGMITLEAGAPINGVANGGALLDLQTGSIIDLSVATLRPGAVSVPGSSAFLGQYEGTLHLRAPRTADDVRIGSMATSLVGGSAVMVEPVRVYQPAGGIMNIALRNTMHADNTAFMAAAEAGMQTRLLAGADPALSDLLVFTPGVEIINPKGDLVLGLANNTPAGSLDPEALHTADWDLSGFRYGSRNAPGMLTLRAAGDLVFNNALSDGFTGLATPSAQIFANSGNSLLWLAPLTAIDPLRPATVQSWSYRLTAGADLMAADARATLPLAALAAGKGSVLVGEFYPTLPNSNTTGGAAAIGRDGQTASTMRISTTLINRGTRYEVIRTGTGSIDVNAGRDVQMRNPFATIYTAGVGVPVRSQIFQPGDFSLPLTTPAFHPAQGASLGAVQQNYVAYFGFAGGDVRVSAGVDIGRFNQVGGVAVPDAGGQIPTNWLYRRGLIDQATGLFAADGVGAGGLSSILDPSMSTTWWVDYSNFFQGFGALGGGNVALQAGRDLVNADAAIPTNARMAGIDPISGRNLAPNLANLQELGGGDLLLRAGRNIDGGNFYVQRGGGILAAGNEVTTNSSQSPSRGFLGLSGSVPEVLDPLTWQAVTLYGGSAHFQVSARGNVLLGPVTNPFLLPQGLNNKFWYKTQFHTIGANGGVSVSSFGGSVTHRLAVLLPGSDLPIPTLVARLGQGAAVSPGALGFFRPWLRLAESNIDNFRVMASVGLPQLDSTAFNGDVRVVGGVNLFPSTEGRLNLLASGAIRGMNPAGVTRTVIEGATVNVTGWSTARLNLSDANPARAPGALRPQGFQQFLGDRELLTVRDSPINPVAGFQVLFQETGAFTGPAAAIDVQSALHSPTPLYQENPNPVRLYAGEGDISGLTLFSPTTVRILAQRDITDVALYFQHPTEDDLSVISAGRDIIPFNENATVRALARDIEQRNIVVEPPQNTVLRDSANLPISTRALAGDIQVGGVGTLQVLAGRNLDLGTGANFIDGTGVGITSIGRARNPFLPFGGTDLILIAGFSGSDGGPVVSLADRFGLPQTGRVGNDIRRETEAMRLLADLFVRFRALGASGDPASGYPGAFEAIARLFPGSEARGDLLTRARDVRTSSGGEITIVTPVGGVSMATDIFGNPLTPPGIVTEFGGAVNILTHRNVDIGAARIFTLRGGDLTIWSSTGDIAAGNAPKTVVTAPPTRVLIDATSADVLTDLGGLATGGGIGVLAAVEGVEPGAVTLLAPQGTVDAGDAGIRATGDIAIAAQAVVNADNISAGGATVGAAVSAPASVPAPSLPSATTTTGATTAAAESLAANDPAPIEEPEPAPSLYTVEVLGYGGGTSTEEEEEDRTPERAEGEPTSPPSA